MGLRIVTGNHCPRRRGLRAQGEGTGSHRTGSDVTATGSHVFWEGKPRTSRKKGSWAQGNRKSRVLGGETADQLGKRDRGLRQPEVTCFGMGKPLRNAGSKSKVQFKHRGWSLDSKKKKDAPCWKTKNDLILGFFGFYKRPF